ncbi:hypothetical protein [Pantoea ananatis]|uniref:hypothetical protein n=1 Tax=Pantoea ananas TaxID=553 RepID=UPI00301686E6
MTDFLRSLNEGMESAKRAEENRREIDSVFDELNKQVASVTNGKVKIARATFRSLKEDNIWGLGIALNIPSNYVTYSGLGVFHTAIKGDPIEISKWNSDKNGYPCVIEIDKKKLYCEDKESLEYNIAELLKEPFVGEAIIKMMRRQ